jgi:hypothetical protein
MKHADRGSRIGGQKGFCGLAAANPAATRKLSARTLVLALLLSIFPSSAFAKLREPSFGELCREADVIVVAHVRGTLPGPFSLEAVLLSCLVFSAAWLGWAVRSRTWASACRVALGIAGFTVVAGYYVTSGPFTPRRLAVVELRRALKGSPPNTIFVDYRTNFACDRAHLDPGGDYVLFLDRNHLVGYRLAWFQHSVWPITTDGIESPLTNWSGMTAPTESFFDAVSGILR